MNTREYQLDVCLKDAGKDVFSESYKIALWDTFVGSANPKEHNFKNHLEAFVTQLKRNCTPLPKRTFKKWDVVIASFGMNVGSELQGDRPSIVFKSSRNTFGEDIVVIPLTSAQQQKKTDKFDLFLAKDTSNNLYTNSFARLRQIRAVSLKRLNKRIGTIASQEIRDAIDEKMEEMLGLEKVVTIDGIAE